ncbi:MAG: CBS domain-containing protein [Actinomycetota bacterium]
MSDQRSASTSDPLERLDPFDDDTGPGRDSVTALLATEIVFLQPDVSVRSAAETMRAADVSLAVVGSHEDVIGVVSERDIVSAVALDLDLEATVVDVIETEDLRWSTDQTAVDDVAEEMLENHLRHLLVRGEDGTLAGIVSMRDVLGTYLH